MVLVLEYAKNGLPGVSKTIKTEGDGPVMKMAQRVQATYSVYLEDGVVLASGKGQEVTVGMRQIWGTGGDLGLLSMKVGERALIACEHEFAGASTNVTVDIRLLAVVDTATIAAREHRIIAAIIMFTLIFVVLFMAKEGVLFG